MRQSPTGPATSRFAINQSFDLDSINAKENDALEQAVAMVPTIDVTRDIAIANPRLALTAGLMYGSGSPDMDGTFRIVQGNLTAAPIDPADAVWDCCTVRQFEIPNTAGYVRAASSGLLAGSISSASIDHGNVLTLTTLEAAAAAIVAGPTSHAPVVADPVVVSPRNALPAGLGLSHARVSAAGIVSIGLSNPTNAGINPAAILWDILVLDQSRPNRAARSGRRGVDFRGLVNSASVPAASVVETLVNVPGAQIGDVAHATWSLDLGDELMPSHARVTASGVVAVSLLNLNVTGGGAVDPGPIDVVIQTWPRVPPL